MPPMTPPSPDAPNAAPSAADVSIGAAMDVAVSPISATAATATTAMAKMAAKGGLRPDARTAPIYASSVARRPPPACVAAASGAGKTTLLERLIPALAARGVRCAAVKLTHHDVEIVDSTAEAITRHLNCSVLIVKPPDFVTPVVVEEM